MDGQVIDYAYLHNFCNHVLETFFSAHFRSSLGLSIFGREVFVINKNKTTTTSCEII